MMKSLAQIAKILGPKGLMPSPKTETVTKDIKKIIGELKSGKITFKVDKGGNLHQIIGKVSQETKKLEDNFKTFLEAVKRAKPQGSKGVFIQKITLSSTMGPGIKISA
jgi:large subunit ribosomal protein L1